MDKREQKASGAENRIGGEHSAGVLFTGERPQRAALSDHYGSAPRALRDFSVDAPGLGHRDVLDHGRSAAGRNGAE